MSELWKPAVGDTIRMVLAGPPVIGKDITHGSVGEVFRVIAVHSDFARGNEILVDHCSCNGSVDNHQDFKWTWASWSRLFEPYVPITPEEADRAHRMPSPEDVAALLGLKRNV